MAVGTKVIVFGGANRAATPFTDLWVLETGKPPAGERILLAGAEHLKYKLTRKVESFVHC